MNILICGGAGFIGSHVAKHHKKHGDTVYIIDNLITGRKENIADLRNDAAVTFYEEDIVSFDFSSIGACDVVYNLASPASPIQYKKYPIKTMMANAEGSRNVLEYVRKYPKTVYLYASTSEVYGDPLEHPQKETYWGNVNPHGVRSCYDEAKRYGEALAMSYVRMYNLNVRIARIFNTYGPYMEQNDGRVVSNFITQALSNNPITIYGDGSQTRSFCYVDDMVDGLTSFALSRVCQKGEVVNIGNPEEHTISWLAQKVKEHVKSNSEITYTPIDEDDPTKRKPDISKAKQILNWNPKTSLDEGLDKTISYFKQLYS
jgi:nucleoside-diphosphate-sugar epimerase